MHSLYRFKSGASVLDYKASISLFFYLNSINVTADKHQLTA